VSSPNLTSRLEQLIFGHRMLIIVLFAVVTLGLTVLAVRGLRIDASFTKQLPTKHEYMQTYLADGVAEFRGANRVLIALIAGDGNMFTPEFFEALKRATDEVIVMDGIDRGRVQSLFTPNVRYLEVVEDGIEAGNVVPADFQPTPESMAQVRENILKAGIVGRLVANDFSGALVSAIVLEEDANGVPIDPIEVSRQLEERVRQQLEGTGRSAHDRLRESRRRYRGGRAFRDRVRGEHAHFDPARRLALLPVVSCRAGAGGVLGHRRVMAAWRARAARLRNRSAGPAGALPDLRHRRESWRAEDQRGE
jgi:hypothetical protein